VEEAVVAAAVAVVAEPRVAERLQLQEHLPPLEQPLLPQRLSRL